VIGVSLAPGARLGSYEIVDLLGAGGMGEVYRARDTKLGREVALKILAGPLAAEPERRARFEREARLLACLNHASIATLFGFEEADGLRFLVMELVPGETLDERLARSPLTVEAALALARQIAEALEAAHAQGIVHRDLKPANVKVTPDGRAKVLDFGLAKALDPSSTGDLSDSPTLTRAGAVLGTAAYMSPEQARGREVDRRADVWGFGCVLFVMLCGRRPFGGETSPVTLAAVLQGEPEWAALPREVPPSIRRLLRRCLEKDPERRLRDARDIRLEIEEALGKGRRGGRRRPARTGGARPSRADRAPIGEPRLVQLSVRRAIHTSPAWSPDASALVYSVQVSDVRKVFLKRLATGEEEQVTHGGHDDIQPTWSPDGRRIVFVRSRQAGERLEPGDVFGHYVDGDLWSIDLVGGAEAKLAEGAFNPSFSPDGASIAVDASWAGPRRLWIVDAQGRNPQQVTTDVSEAIVHVRPRFSPDGRRLVFQNVERTKFDVRVVEVASRSLAWITNDPAQDLAPVWSASGRFIYFSSYRSGGLNIWRVPVSLSGKPVGRLQQVTKGAGQDVDVALSPDGRGLAFATLRQNADIWRLPVEPATGRPVGPPHELVATTREDSRGAWSPDGRRIAFNSDRTGDMNIWIHSLDGGETVPLTHGPGGDFQPNWSPDGRTIAFFSSRSGSVDIWKVDVASEELAPLTRGGGIHANPFFSPDGAWIAYQSDAGGRLEVWVMRADGGDARPLTRVGTTGHFLRWTKDGEAIVFRTPGGGSPRSLKVALDGTSLGDLPEVAGGAHMSFSPDFSRILDVVGHRTMWVSPLVSGTPEKVFEFEDPDVRIDYPLWSPDGAFVLFDRFRPEGGDLWLMTDAG
jgi:Tol biopolymer transport system component/predicted Ser/Thr protein kinase